MKYKNITRILLVVLILAVMAGIFILSNENRDESTDTSDAVINPIIKLLYPDFDDLEPSKQTAILNEFNVTIRTGAHYLEYLVLGTLCVGLVLTFKTEHVPLYILIPLGIGALYAISDEIHQYFVPGRSCQISDIIIDTCGALTGILIIFTIVCIIKAHHEKQEVAVDN